MLNKLSASKSAPVFRFETIGDQLVFVFHELKTVKTSRGEDAVLCECEAVAGEQLNKETKKIESWPKGPTAFFLSTQLRRLFREQRPIKGDLARVQFAEIGQPRNVKLYGWEYLQKVPRSSDGTSGGNPPDDDDLPEFAVPT